MSGIRARVISRCFRPYFCTKSSCWKHQKEVNRVTWIIIMPKYYAVLLRYKVAHTSVTTRISYTAVESTENESVEFRFRVFARVSAVDRLVINSVVSTHATHQNTTRWFPGKILLNPRNGSSQRSRETRNPWRTRTVNRHIVFRIIW